MGGEEQAAAYARADFEEPHSRFITLLGERLPGLPKTGHALDLGCGSGDISLRFARSPAHPGWQVDGVDGSAAMLAWARRDAAEVGLEGRARFVEAFLPTEDLPREGYDLVFSNSLLHHLGDPLVLWQSVQRWGGAGAAVFVMDLLRPESPEQARELVETHASGEPEVLRTDFYNSLLAAYRLDEVEQQLAQGGLESLRVEAVSDRHFIAWGHLG